MTDQGGGPAAIVARLEAAAERTTTPFDGGRMVWRRWGAGAPVVLVHGASGSWTHWIRNIESLAERAAVLVPDLPGFGDSDPLPEPHTAERLADALVAGLDGQGALDLVGFSFGSIVAGLAAARLGARARRLVMLGPGGMAFRSDVDRIALARVERGMNEAEIRAVHRTNLTALMLADPAAADELAVSLQIDNVRRARFRSGTIPASDVLLRAMPAITARVSAIFGGRDAFAVPYMDERRDTLARCHVVDVRVVEGAGHWVGYEAPSTINRALRELLD